MNNISDLGNELANSGLNDHAIKWNKFIENVCFKKLPELTQRQKSAVLAFWYDAEMNSGGHSGYFDCYSDVNPDELVWALKEIGGEQYINNYLEALKDGMKDGFLKTDNYFYSSKPQLTDLVMKYVMKYSL